MRRRSVSVTPMAPSPNSCSQLMVVVVVVWWVEVWVDSAAGRRMKVSGGTEAYGAFPEHHREPFGEPGEEPFGEPWSCDGGRGEVGFGAGRWDGTRTLLLCTSTLWKRERLSQCRHLTQR